MDCGKPTNGSDGPGKAADRCITCYNHQFKVWTPEAIVTAIKRWADEHGGVPPTAVDWRAHGEYWPASSTVVYEMGWRNAISAAGFDAFGPGQYGREGEYRHVLEETVRLYRSGLSCEEVGKEMGVGAMAVRMRLIKMNEPRRPAHRRAAV